MSGFESPEGGVSGENDPADAAGRPPAGAPYPAAAPQYPPYPPYPPTAAYPPGPLYPGGPAGSVDPNLAGIQPPGQMPGPMPGYAYQVPYPYLPGYGGPQPGTNGMSIAAMVCGICGFIYGVPGILGIVFGFVGLSQIKRTGQQGRGMAIAGIVCGIVWLVLFIAVIILANVLFDDLPSN